MRKFLSIHVLLRGASSVMDIKPNRSEIVFRLYTPAQSTLEAMASNFYAVGEDFKKVIDGQKDQPTGQAPQLP